jgi:hypothetical protein
MRLNISHTDMGSKWGRDSGQLQGYELSVPFGYLLDGSPSRPGRWSYIPVPVWSRTSVFHSITSHFRNSIVRSETKRYFVLICVNVLFTLKAEVNTRPAYLVAGKKGDSSVGITTPYSFEVRHPRCVPTKSNYKVYAYIVKHNCI